MITFWGVSISKDKSIGEEGCPRNLHTTQKNVQYKFED